MTAIASAAAISRPPAACSGDILCFPFSHCRRASTHFGAAPLFHSNRAPTAQRAYQQSSLLAQIAVRCDPQMRQEYLLGCHRKTKGVDKVAARRSALRLYGMQRTNTRYQELV